MSSKIAAKRVVIYPKPQIPQVKLMKVLGILGGAKRDGNTAKLVGEVLAGAKEVGMKPSYIGLCI